MANGALGYWCRRASLAYQQMQKRHQPLWRYVHQFINENNIASCLEVGCGLHSPVKPWVHDWWGIDLNQQVKDAYHIDFTGPMFVPMQITKKDLLLACAVIEHTDRWNIFLDHAAQYNAPWTFVTFFNGLERSRSKIRVTKDGIYVNSYARSTITAKCKELGLDFRYEQIEQDAILIIKGK